MSQLSTVRIDCHVHTCGSFDSTTTVRQVLETAAEAGLDGLVVTDHDQIAQSLRVAARAPAFDLVGIPGVELSTAAGHVLGIGIDTRPASGQSFTETVTRIRELGGIAVVPHPFQLTRHGVSAAAISDCDGIEVFNAHRLTGIRNRQAAKFADQHGFPRFGGSDAHRPELVGRAYTVVDIGSQPATSESVVEAMRNGRTRAGGVGAPLSQYLRKYAENFRRSSTKLLPVSL